MVARLGLNTRGSVSATPNLHLRSSTTLTWREKSKTLRYWTSNGQNTGKVLKLGNNCVVAKEFLEFCAFGGYLFVGVLHLAWTEFLMPTDGADDPVAAKPATSPLRQTTCKHHQLSPATNQHASRAAFQPSATPKMGHRAKLPSTPKN